MSTIIKLICPNHLCQATDEPEFEGEWRLSDIGTTRCSKCNEKLLIKREQTGQFRIECAGFYAKADPKNKPTYSFD